MTDLVDIGFSISLGDERIIADNFRDSFGRKPDKADWEILSDDVEKLETAIYKQMKHIFPKIREEGHSGDDDALVGTVWLDSNKEYNLVTDRLNDFEDNNNGTYTIYGHNEPANDFIMKYHLDKDCSEFVSCLMPSISFFEVPEEYLEDMRAI